MFKPDVEHSLMKVLERRFKVEREFYTFVRRRLNDQYEKLLERSKISERLRND